jgi:hypothetical protein
MVRRRSGDGQRKNRVKFGVITAYYGISIDKMSDLNFLRIFLKERIFGKALEVL